jgi:hypothetical protein
LRLPSAMQSISARRGARVKHNLEERDFYHGLLAARGFSRHAA